MLYSRTTEDRKVDFFVSMLKHLVNGEEGYATFIDPVIDDAHKLSIGQKNYYTIDRDSYPIIVYLVDTERDYFANLNPQNLNQAHYQHIMNMLVEQREYAFA